MASVLRRRPGVLRCCRPRPPVDSCRTHTTTTLVLAIETSCDDTCVAILEKRGPAARLLFNRTVTSDSRAYGGIHPDVAMAGHTAHLAALVRDALPSLPPLRPADGPARALHRASGRPARKPDLVAVTRGPGFGASLATGLATAKGLAVAWDLPLLALHHMQAHALTPRLASALRRPAPAPAPAFPFLTLLVSGSHAQLVLSRALTAHRVLAAPARAGAAVGDMLDKAARAILPARARRAAGDTAYARALEAFVFPPSPSAGSDYGYDCGADAVDTPRATRWGWALRPPAHARMEYEFGGLNGQVQSLVAARFGGGAEGKQEEEEEEKEEEEEEERRMLGREVMRVAFEHLASRVVLFLRGGGGGDVSTLVVAGGVASNGFLRHVLRAVLEARGLGHVAVVAAPAALCTDNAAMVAWAGAEMWEAGWHTGLGVRALSRWSVDPAAEDGGIMGVDGWIRRGETSA